MQIESESNGLKPLSGLVFVRLPANSYLSMTI